jgi:hypothetical protein
MQGNFHSLDNNIQNFYYKTYIQKDKIIIYKLHVYKLFFLKFIFILV